MATVLTSDLFLSNITFSNNKNIENVDCSNMAWKNDTMYWAFGNCTNLKIVANLNDDVRDIGYAFYNCHNMIEPPTIPNSVTNMYTTFRNCFNLKNAPTIPNNVTDIGWAFQNCYNMTSTPQIPSSVTIASNAFQGCNNIVSGGNFPRMCNELSAVYWNCTNLTGDIYFEASHSNSFSNTFNGTSLAKNVYIPLGNTPTHKKFSSAYPSGRNGVTICEHPNYTTIDGWYYHMPSKSIVGYVGSSNVATVPSSFVDLDETSEKYNYLNVSDYTYTINDKTGILEGYIGTSTNITVPTIEEKTPVTYLFTPHFFNANYYIKSVDLSNVPCYDNSMYFFFGHCRNLVSATNINKNVTNMYQTYFNCLNLVTLEEFPPNVTDMALMCSWCNKLENVPSIPNSVTDMGYAFSECNNLKNAPALPPNVNSVYSCFEGCRGLINAPTIPNSVTSMSSMFSKCMNLKNVPPLPSSVTDLAYTFNGCTNLIEPPDVSNSINLTRIYNAFNGCTNLSYTPDMSHVVTKANMTAMFARCSNLITVNPLPPYTESLSQTFINCTSILTAPAIPSAVTNMYKTFDNCVNLCGDVYIKSKDIMNCSNCFNNTQYTKNVYIPFTYTKDFNKTLYCLYDATNNYKCYLDVDPSDMPYHVMIAYKNDGSIDSNIRYVMKQTLPTGTAYRVMTMSGTYICNDDYTNNVNLVILSGTSTITYNSFISAGYDVNGSLNGVFLKDINPLL